MKHLVRYISRSDVDLVLARIPESLRSRVRRVMFHGDSRGVTTLGFVTKSRREITLCAWLPPRVSLRLFMYCGCIAAEFGAPERGQWPPWAVRRMLLYDTLLHEIGHMQIRDDEFAGEKRAQEFANDLRGELFARHFDHPDPVHNAPSDDELAMIPLWERLDKEARRDLTRRVLAGEFEVGEFLRRASGFGARASGV